MVLLKERDYLEELGIDGSIIVTGISGLEGVFVRLRTHTYGVLLSTFSGPPLRLTKCGKFLAAE
jgi:hypothetical protein